MGGLQLVETMRAMGTTTPVLLVSGYSLDDVTTFCRSHALVRMLGKPWAPLQLRAAIEELIVAARLAGAAGVAEPIVSR